MIIFRVPLCLAQLACVQPVKILRKPLQHRSAILCLHRFRRNQRCRPRHLRQVKRVDDPIRPPRRNSDHCLRVLEIRIHPRVGINKPRRQVVAGALRIPPVSRQHPRCRQCRHLLRQRDHHLSVRVEIVRIALAVAVYVWPLRILGIRPEVVCLRKIIVQPSRTVSRGERRDRHRLQVDILTRGAKDSLSICPRHKPVAL